jgi:hypothetical protein
LMGIADAAGAAVVVVGKQAQAPRRAAQTAFPRAGRRELAAAPRCRRRRPRRAAAPVAAEWSTAMLKSSTLCLTERQELFDTRAARASPWSASAPLGVRRALRCTAPHRRGLEPATRSHVHFATRCRRSQATRANVMHNECMVQGRDV